MCCIGLATDFTYTSGSGYDRLIDLCNLARIRVTAVGCLVQRLTLRLMVFVARCLFLLRAWLRLQLRLGLAMCNDDVVCVVNLVVDLSGV